MNTERAVNRPIIPEGGPRGYPLVGVIPTVWRDPLGFLTDTARRYGDVAKFHIGSRVAYLVNEPECIGRILQRDKSEDTIGMFNRGMRSVFGGGLQTSRGELWREQRLLLQPAFHKVRIGTLCDQVVCPATNEMLERWKLPAAAGTVLDMADEMRRLTTTLSLRTMLGQDIPEEMEEVTKAFATINEQLFYRLLVRWFAYLPTVGNVRFRQALAVIDKALCRVIERRKAQEACGRDDPLSILLDASKPSKIGFSDTQLRGHLVTLLFAGQETTANALAWTLYLISQHPQAETAILNEVAQELGGKPPAADTFLRLTYTRWVVQEALRLYPPVYVLAPSTGSDTLVSGAFVIPAGSQLIVSQYVMHRHPKYWDKPDQFEPERFSKERSAGRPKYAYFPFGRGPQTCIGAQLAMMQMVSIVAKVIKAYQLRLVPSYPVVPQAALTLRPRYGVPMLLEPR